MSSKSSCLIALTAFELKAMVKLTGGLKRYVMRAVCRPSHRGCCIDDHGAHGVGHVTCGSPR
eukprot:COSAG02_NODE_1684_length_11324_cov_8.190111_6_plen_62_part_00